MSKEKLQPNKVPPTLFVGVGGIGSKIIAKVADLSRHDDMSRTRFVILDTDINDLRMNDENVRVSAIQTSSTRTIRDYLLQDDDARTEWFPNNMIINNKNVSEGAGQIRAISRLALNATIRTGKINKLYKAIDELYLKDGSDKKQTIKVVIASTVAGGTGSGIAMIVGMLIRNYITKNYPESCAVIRGFLLMPGVMEALPDLSYSEKRSLQRNGYATIREINAFMMRPFFGAVPELRRYKNLHIAVPTTGNQTEKLDCLPFDFCFLFDRADENEFNMNSLEQYRQYVAHAIYEQNIGSLSRSAASKEDNVLKEFLNEEKLGRSRFGGAGAARVRYPYESIVNYIAYQWLEETILGVSSDDVQDERKREEAIDQSWLTYDRIYFDKKKAFDNGADASLEAPVRAKIYVDAIDTGSDDFSKELRKKHIDHKNSRYDGNNAVASYISALINHVSTLYSRTVNLDMLGSISACSQPDSKSCTTRYNKITTIANFVRSADIRTVAVSMAESIFNSKGEMKSGLEDFKIESFLSIDGVALHPNAMRYFLYILKDALVEMSETEPSQSQCDAAFAECKFGSKTDANGATVPDPDRFKVTGHIGKETNLYQMCQAVDDPIAEALVSSAKDTCSRYLTEYCSAVEAQFKGMIRFHICNIAKMYVERLIVKFEEFYDSFGDKVVGVQKKKSSIIGEIAFHNGDCVYNVFNNRNYLACLVKSLGKSTDESSYTKELNGDIFCAIKDNAVAAERMKNDTFSKDTLTDVFDGVIVEFFRKVVTEKCKDALDIDILRAIALEFKMKCVYEASHAEKHEQEEILAAANDYEKLNAYVLEIIGVGKNLACPSITRKTFDESREVSAIGYSDRLVEKEGIQIPYEFDGKNASDSISIRELHFFRSIYDVMPTQISKLCAPEVRIDELDDGIDDDILCGGAVGEYFIAYQEYMQKIGPDNRLNPVITPHIDKRWNSISVLPELDPKGYQRRLMKSIHEAFVYGFIYGIIDKHSYSTYDPDKYVYRYKDGENGTKEFIVSNHTKCDRLFEVLDSLYFDRYAVKSISDAADEIREYEYHRSTAYEKTSFVKAVSAIDRTQFIDELHLIEEAKKYSGYEASIFEIVLFYWNSLPKKDASEIEIMIEAIFDIISKEIATFADDKNINPLIALRLVEHCNKLQRNYIASPELFSGDNVVAVDSNDVILTIRKMVKAKVAKLDVSDSPKFQVESFDASKAEVDKKA